MHIKTPLSCRNAAVLLHPTSLPGAHLAGTLGQDAFHFIDFLQESGFGAWQVLPLGPTNDDLSPYQSPSAFAGNVRLISPEILANQGLINRLPDVLITDADYQSMIAEVWEQLQGFQHAQIRRAFDVFKEEQRSWLQDFALFSSIKSHQQNLPWHMWPEGVKAHDKESLKTIERSHEQSINIKQLEQFLFFEQWRTVKNYANERGIQIIGDLAIFVSHDSADVWSNQSQFNLDDDGGPVTIAGVPPDYFSATGQRWGNPHYRWDVMEKNNFEWWNSRVTHMLKSFDLVRIDHFRGFESYWEIPASEETAINGRWVNAPGYALFESIKQNHPNLPLIAEDLGIITEEVINLRLHFNLPGMKVLQFAFDDDGHNPYLPHNHAHNSVVYTGTHDNNTTVGWYDESSERTRSKVSEYLGYPDEPMPWPLIRSALASVSSLAVIPMQDLLSLDKQHRFNTPGTTTGNWEWRFQWDYLPTTLAGRLSQMLESYGRR